jgi:hypothetical protein
VAAGLIHTCFSEEENMSVIREKVEPATIVFADDGLVPNNPMPFLVYEGAVALDRGHPEQTIEELFAANGWGAMWRNGVYDFLHYHATVHEVLGIARGHARVCFGGDHGKELEISAGDPARRHRASMPRRDAGLLRGRRLSAGTADGFAAADAGEPCEGKEDDPASEAAEDRSGHGRQWTAAEVVDTRLAARRENGRKHGTVITKSFACNLVRQDQQDRDWFLFSVCANIVRVEVAERRPSTAHFHRIYSDTLPRYCRRSPAFYAADVDCSLACATSGTQVRELRSRKASGCEKGVPGQAIHRDSIHP